MADAGMGLVWAVALASLLLSWLIETGLSTPRIAAPWRRPASANAIHAGLWLLDFALLLAVTRRPWFALALQAAQTLLIVVVSRIKWRTLREPFIVQDFEYFVDLFRHPRLYLPFFGIWRAVAGLLLFVAACSTGLWLEPALPMQAGWAWLVLVGAVLLAAGASRSEALEFSPAADIGRLGMVTAAWHYARAARRPPADGWPRSPYDTLVATPDAARPTLVMVQAESFFDARRHYKQVRADMLPEFDALCREAQAFGPLRVPPWGANTVRSEYALLSGLTGQAMGVHRFNPYHRLARQGIGTLASWLRKQGYRTVCVHPYPASFYGRDVVYPLMGFDEFIDIEAFGAAARDGAYVGDMALGEFVAQLIDAEARKQPLFVFVLTMESHGPLHLDAVTDADVLAAYGTPPPPGCEELTVYLKHQKNADRMLGQLSRHLAARSTPAVLGFHGDHVPPMPDAYDALGSPDGFTDYVIWRSGARGIATAHALGVDELGLRFLSAAGLVDVSGGAAKA